MEIEIGGVKLRTLQGDITKIPADVIVNAANSDLAGGGGVDGAIHRAGGPSIMGELNRIRPKGGCPTGSAVVTGAGDLPARFVVHAVGPVWRGGGVGEADLLADAYLMSLKLAVERKARSVSFPAISTGVYGYPVHQAAAVAVGAVAGFLKGRQTGIGEIVFVLFDGRALSAYDQALRALGV